ncbi:MAG: hypothetical protein ABSE73_18975 [Planctomycetota bacterium]
MSKFILAAMFVFSCLVGLRAGEEPTPPPLVVRERTVYVPYEKLKETFEKEGKGVFLPYEEFLKLWNAGQPKEKPPEEIKPPADAVISGGSYTGVAKEAAVRFEVTYKVKALGKAWSELALPLKDVAVETVTLSDPQAVFAAKGDGYTALFLKPGEYTLTLAFSVRVDSKPGLRKIEFGIPPTAVSRLEIAIPEKDLRVEVTPKMAATVTTPEGAGTKLLAFVGNAAQVAVTWMPPVGKVEKGEAITTASQTMQVELGERILVLDTAIVYKIERNEEEVFRIRPPKDMRLLSVKGNNIREWVTEQDVLLVRLHSPVKESYALALRFERVLAATPDKLEVPFPVLAGVLREDGFITLAHEAGLRVRVESSTGLSQVDPRELPEPLRRPNLLAGFRYLAHPLALALKIEQVQPQMQSSVIAVTSLGVEEDGMFGTVEYQIAKVGVFTLKLKVESRWEPVTIGEPATVEDFQTATEGQYKVLTVNLKNKALGKFLLPFKFTGPSRAEPKDLTLESVQVPGTQQDKGLLGVSAPKAFKLTTVERKNMSSANVQQLVTSGLLAQLPPDFDLPLAYSYNQQPASVKVTLERRQTEIRVTGYHTAIITEAGLDMTHKLEYVITFAGVDKLQFSVPSTLDDRLLDIKCPGFKEKKKTGEKEGRSTWEVLLQEKTLGVVPLTIIHKENLKESEPEKPQELTVPDVRPEEVKAETGFIAVCKESALEIEPVATGLEPLETVNLPTEMRPSSISNIYLAYRYYQPERKLTLKLVRHVPIELAKAVVDLLRVTFVVSEEKQLAVSAELWVENEKGEQYLELKLGDKDVRVRSVAVNGVSTSPLERKGGGTLVKLAAAGGPFPVQIIYSMPLGEGGSKLGPLGGLQLKTLEVLEGEKQHGVPVNKIEAEVWLPEEYSYLGFRGTLHPRPADEPPSNALAWINSLRQQRGAARIDRLPPLLGAFVTEGRRFSFQTLDRMGTLSLNYCDRKLLVVFDVLVFLAALAAGVLLARKKAGWERRRLAGLWVCLGFVLVPLCLRWFATSDARELFSAWLAAGVALSAAFVAWHAAGAYRVWRAERVARAPDPFLEEAPEKPAPPESRRDAGAPKPEAPPEVPKDAGAPKPETPAGEKPETSPKDQDKGTGGEEQK